MSKIIITGSRGLIGTEVTKYFSSTDHEVLELDKTLGHDLIDERFVKSWFYYNKADYLVNLFAINDHVNIENPNNHLMDISLDSMRDYLEVNVVALFSVCREFARNNHGGIINFSSLYGINSPRPDMYGGGQKHIGYGVSKSAVIQLTKHLAVHLAPYTRVNVVVPGGIENEQPETFKEKYSSHTALKRMMRKDELNGILDFLCSEKSSYSTGSVYVIDGGYLSF